MYHMNEKKNEVVTRLRTKCQNHTSHLQQPYIDSTQSYELDYQSRLSFLLAQTRTRCTCKDLAIRTIQIVGITLQKAIMVSYSPSILILPVSWFMVFHLLLPKEKWKLKLKLNLVLEWTLIYYVLLVQFSVYKSVETQYDHQETTNITVFQRKQTPLNQLQEPSSAALRSKSSQCLIFYEASPYYCCYCCCPRCMSHSLLFIIISGCAVVFVQVQFKRGILNQ